MKWKKIYKHLMNAWEAYWRRNVSYRWHDLQGKKKISKSERVILFYLDGLDDVDVDLGASLES
jgi:hypothetical protein